VAAAEATFADLQAAERAAAAERGAAAARAEALALGLERRDGSAALLAAGDRLDGLLGSVAALISVRPGSEVAIAAALGAAADAIAVTGLDAAVNAFSHLKAEDLGRAGLLLGGVAGPDTSGWPQLPAGAIYAGELVECAANLRPAIERLLFKVAVVEDLPRGRELVSQLPDVTAVTADGDVLSAWFAAGGSSSTPSLLEVQAALDEANTRLGAAQAETERLRFALAEAEHVLAAARERSDAALARLHESDAAHAALAEEAGELNQTVRSAQAEAGRLAAAAQTAATARDQAIASLGELEARLELASAQTELSEADPTERDHSGDRARAARSAEMDARLALRTVEERARALAGRAESLTRAAEAERSARAKAAARREQLRREAEVAAAVKLAADWLAERVAASRALAEEERTRTQQLRNEAEAELTAVRQRGRELARAFEGLVDTVHADELARAQRQMKIDALAEKALTELGLDTEALAAEYGPQCLVPVLLTPDGLPVTEDDPTPDPVPYVRAEQEKRLRQAERDLAVLGKVNPLALEEFDALSERHTFLAEQLADLRKTRDDLLDIIADVDTRVQEVFAAAYADVEKAFEESFARLFPGGEGRLVLTEPGEWLTTGVEVEARPAGKKVKRLSLLSGGERSLVAVAFLVALFKARPSPFYILDEVEAALDDTNLGRLLEIYEELRATSQLLVITHQKRTMEIADALYGVTMRSDGVSAVISQRLREA
jgi:chromosome segregation protein